MNKWVKLSELCNKITDGSHFSPTGVTNGFPMLSVKDMRENGFDYKECKFINKGDYESLVRADCKPLKNDVLIAKDGSYLKHVFVVESEKKEAILSSIGIIRPNLNKVNPYYIKYFLHSDFVKKEVAKKYVTGSALPRIILKNFGEILIPYRKKPEQDKIVNILKTIDSKIEINKKINSKIEEISKSIYDYWFVQFDFPNRNGRPYRSGGGHLVWNKKLKRQIPSEWVDGTLSDIGDIIGGSTPPKNDKDNFTKEGVPWITPKDLSLNKDKKFISKGEIDVSEGGIKSASLYIMPRGTVLFSSRAPIGYVAISRNEITTNQGFKSFVPKPGFSTPFVYYTVKNTIPVIVNHASGSTFKEISGTVLKAISVCLPPYKLVEKFTTIVDPLFKKQDLLELENEQLSNLRDWLLPMLMNGQVKVQ